MRGCPPAQNRGNLRQTRGGTREPSLFCDRAPSLRQNAVSGGSHKKTRFWGGPGDGVLQHNAHWRYMQRLLVLEAVAQQTMKSLFVNVVVHHSEGMVSVIYALRQELVQTAG